MGFKRGDDRQGASFYEIALALGTTRPTAEAIYTRALAKLRKRMAGWDISDSPRFSSYDTRLVQAVLRTRYTERAALREHQYRDWDDTMSRVVSGPIGLNKFPGRSFTTRQDARNYWLGRGASIIEEYPLPGRWIIRIRRCDLRPETALCPSSTLTPTSTTPGP